MSMDWDDYGHDEHMAELGQEEYEAELIEKSLKSISEDGARGYLMENGDDAQARIDNAKSEATALIGSNFFAASVIRSATAIEVMIRDLILMPLVQGAFLSEEWAATLTKRIAGSRSADNRSIVPSILSRWGVEVESLSFDDGKPLWAFIRGELWPKRNSIIHAGASADKQEALRASAAAKAMEELIIRPLAGKLGFRLDAGKKWSDGP